MDEIIYFELNNWCPEENYPPEEPFMSWIGEGEDENKVYLTSRRWCKENKLVVTFGPIDMSLNFCIGATKKWVEENCPTLLTKYTKFLRPNMKSIFGQPFKEYCEENIGIHCCDINREKHEYEFLTDNDMKDNWYEDRDKEIYGE